MKTTKKKYRNIEKELLAKKKNINLEEELANHCETINYDKTSVKKELFTGHSLQKNESKKSTTTELTQKKPQNIRKKQMLLFKEIMTKKYC